MTAGDDAATVRWYDLQTVWDTFAFAFDHKDILKEFIEKKYPAILANAAAGNGEPKI